MSVKHFLFFFLPLFTFSPVKSQTYDSLRVSLLTVNPHSQAVWTIFGHTALRLFDTIRKIDIVFNWGTFDAGKPNFHARFVQGKTDYFLSASYFKSIIEGHTEEGAVVTEQILNIPDDEKDTLFNSLFNNLQPQNIEYRYSFIFDNCTTRPRDIIERFCGGTITYPEQTRPVTFRQLIHQYTQPYPWLKFGIDCVIGSGADSLISLRNELFLPLKLMDALNHSTIKKQNGDIQPVVLSSAVILQSSGPQSTRLKLWDNPFTVGLLIFFLYSVSVFLTYKNKYNFRSFYFLLFFIAGTGGCLVAMLNFFSLHPCVQSNWNILWLHPLHLFACTGFFFRKSFRFINWYHIVNFVTLSGFLMGWYLIPQELNMAFIPFILCMLVVSGLQVVVLKQKRL